MGVRMTAFGRKEVHSCGVRKGIRQEPEVCCIIIFFAVCTSIDLASYFKTISIHQPSLFDSQEPVKLSYMAVFPAHPYPSILARGAECSCIELT